MNINSYTHKIIKILSQSIEFDWKMPFKIDSASSSVGTGFFINKQGYILTCFHVIQNAKKIYAEVPSKGKDKYELKVISVCPQMDLALLQIHDFKVTEYCALDMSSNIKKGNEVFALGFPLGLDNLKLTKGIISGRDEHLYQTDTPINPGNSGGPLIKNNKVIGINSSGFTLSQNVGFAIPIIQFNLIYKDMLKSKYIQLPLFLGLDYNNTHMNSIKAICNKCNGGVYITNVYKNAPISSSKIKKGDVLISINNYKIDNYGLLNKFWLEEKLNVNNILYKYKLNDKIKISYSSKGKIVNTHFINNGFDLPIKTVYPIYQPVKYELFGGLCVMNMSLNHRNVINSVSMQKYTNNKHKIKPSLVISYIFENSYLHNLNIFEAGDMITKVNGTNVNNINNYKKALAKPITKNKQKYIELITCNDKYVLIPLKKTITEHLAFSEIYKYQLSNIYKSFTKL
jgi:S1-C subfamily serine protease